MKIKLLLLNCLIFFFTGLLFPAIVFANSFKPEQKPPNFLILIADDAGMDFGCYGNPSVKTPNVDRLAESGILFEKTFLTSPQCSPSRISILTGKYPHTTRTEDLHTPLPENEKFITQYLQNAGYFTGHNGKTHWGENGSNQFNWYSKNFENFEEFLNQAGNKPFFFWTGFYDPHRVYEENAIAQPHDPGTVIVRKHLVDDSRTRKDIALYYDEIARMDSITGSYLDILENEKLTENTYIIFLSDNGAPFPREKGTLYDAGIQTPFIVQGPGVPANEVYDGLTSTIDLAPTFLALADIEIPAEMPGKSFAGVLTGSFGFTRDFIFSERNWHDCDEHMRAVRSDRYKLILNAYTDKPHGTAADLANSLSWYSLLEKKASDSLSCEQSLIFTVPRPSVEIYDLSSDPDEYYNRAEDPAYRNIAYDLLRVLQEWMLDTNDFPPTRRTRMDNTDRISGIRYYDITPELENELDE
ncbi:MAG: sulfatase [Cyclobacteriaceae bacterium]|nr:sulfatase [Cyclobacteriaceae bacterium]